MKGFIFLAFSHVSSVLSFKQWAMYAGFVYSFHVKIQKLCLNASHIIGPWDSYTILKLIPVSVCTVCLVNNPIFYTSVLSFLDSVTAGVLDLNTFPWGSSQFFFKSSVLLVVGGWRLGLKLHHRGFVSIQTELAFGMETPRGTKTPHF